MSNKVSQPKVLTLIQDLEIDENGLPELTKSQLGNILGGLRMVDECTYPSCTSPCGCTDC
jgi:hypothetical protein